MSALLGSFETSYRHYKLNIVELGPSHDHQYRHFLGEVYSKHGYSGAEHIAPPSFTRLGILAHSGEDGTSRLAGICAVGPAPGPSQDSIVDILEDQVELRGTKVSAATLVELRNFAVSQPFLASPALAMLCCGASTFFTDRAPNVIAYGIVRYGILRSFIAFGPLPAEMEPIHLLGDDGVDDYLIYYDLRGREGVRYLHDRFHHYCLQADKLGRIRELRKARVCEERAV